MRKIIFSIIICITALTASISAYAATTDAVQETNLVKSSISKFGSEYAPPFVIPDSLVDTSTGAVTLKEVDLSLPGKNGFDLNIYREYSSYDNNTKYECFSTSVKNELQKYIGVPYTVEYNGRTQTVYVNYSYEKDILEEAYLSEEEWQTYVEDGGTPDSSGFEYIGLGKLDDSGDVKLTWDKNKQPEEIVANLRDSYDKDDFSGSCISLGNGWNILIPSVVENTSYTASSDTKERKDKYLCDVILEDGQRYTLKYTRIYHKNASDTPNIYEFQDENMKNDYERFSAEIFDEEQIDSRGFTYNLVIKKYDGKTYYFLGNLTNNGNAFIQAISDKYGNIIRYTKNSDGDRLIIDTYGRQVTITGSGITVSAGDLTKNITYNTQKIIDTEKDPNDYYNIFTKYNFMVSENNGSSTDEGLRRTSYIMQNKYVDLFSEQRIDPSGNLVPVLLEISYPTNVKREYTYEEEAAAPQYYYYVEGTSASSRDPHYYLYRVTGEKLYENGILKSDKAFDYDGVWKNTIVTKLDVLKTFITEETLENGTEKTTKDEYDGFGRIMAKEIKYKGTETHTLRTEYHYHNGDPDYSVDESLATLYKIRNGLLRCVVNYEDGKYVSSTDSNYDKVSRQPLYTEFGESKTTYTYDDTYYMPLTTVEKRLDKSDIKQSNTLTSDKKSIATTRTYEGTTEKNRTDYTYNTDGTIAKTTVYNNTENIVTEYTYSYADDCSYTVTATVKAVSDADGISTDVSTITAYDSLGRMISQTDGEGNVTRYEYNMFGQVTKVINPDNSFKQIAYNIPENIVTVTDEKGNVTSEAYTPTGNIESIYFDNDESKKAATFTYDNLGRKTSETAYMDYGEEGMTYEYTYDDLDRVVTETSKNGSTVLNTATHSYETDEGTVVSGTSGKTKINVSDYEKAEILMYNSYIGSSKDSAYRVFQYDGDVVLNESYERYQTDTYILDIKDVDELVLSCTSGAYYKYRLRLIPNDADANMIGGASHKVTTTYTGDSTYVKPTSVVTTNGYGNVVEESYYNGAVADANLLNKNKYTYDYQGNVLQSIGGRILMENLGTYSAKTEYDYAGRPVKEYRADGSYITKTYDKLGNMTASTDYMGNTTTYTYDKLGRQIRTEAPFSGSNTTEALTYYDKCGNIIKTKQQNNKPGEAVSYSETVNEYDSRNRLSLTKVNDGTEDIYTQYQYDVMNNMTAYVTGHEIKTIVPDAINNFDNTTYATYEYDRFGNVTRETDSLGNFKTATYNLYGLPTEETNKNGKTFYYMYNAFGSPTWVEDDGVGESYDMLYGYNAYNMPLMYWDMENTQQTTLTYDEYGYVNEETDENTQVSSVYTNDVNGNRKRLEVKDGSTVVMTADYTYDILDRLTNVSFDNGSASVSYTYDANGNVLTETKNGEVTEYAYNKAGLMTAQTGGNAPDYSMTYSFDGNKVSETDSINGIKNYIYDGIGQLKSETITQNGAVSDTITYSYDTRGNRVMMNNNGVITNYTYDRNNKLISDSSSERTNSYAYDNNGNLISRLSGSFVDVNNSVAQEQSINVFGTSAQVQNTEDSTAVYYSYDPMNKLKSVTSDDGVTASYTYDAKGRRISKTVNNVTTNHIWDGDYIVREKDNAGTETSRYYRAGNKLVANKTNNVTNYYFSDPHGNTVSIGNNENIYTYDAFGNQTSTPANDTNPFRYCGEYFDSETGFVYLRARYYNPTTGRFISEDPAKDGLNWYVYCGNNPVMFVDPSGETGEPIVLLNPWVRQQAIWMNGIRALDVIGLDVSAQMLHHSIRWFSADDVLITDQWSGVNVYGTDRIDGNAVVYSLRNNSAINNEIDWLISCYEKDGLTRFESDGIVLPLNDTTDLYLSFNNATVKLVGDKSADGQWYINVYVHDVYDFAIEKYSDIESFKSAIGSAAGSFAAIEQTPLIGAIKTYEIDVNFKVVK